MSKIRGRIVAIARAHSPVHHGGDTVGNVQQFRTHEVKHAEDFWTVPYISGASQKSQNRRSAAWFNLAALGLDDSPNFTRKEIQLLLAGGALTGAGQSVRLDDAREVEEAIPALGLHGYSAGNAMQESQVTVDLLELACKERADVYQEALDAYEPELSSALDEYASEYLRVYDGYPKDPVHRRENRQLLEDEERAEIEETISSDKKDEDDARMVHEFECLSPGSVLVGGYAFANGIKKRELQAFRSAFTWASEGRGPNGGLVLRIGGKTSRGFGKIEMHLHGQLAEGIEPTTYYDTDDLCPDVAGGDEYDDDLRDYIEYLTDQEDVREKLKEIA